MITQLKQELDNWNYRDQFYLAEMLPITQQRISLVVQDNNNNQALLNSENSENNEINPVTDLDTDQGITEDVTTGDLNIHSSISIQIS